MQDLKGGLPLLQRPYTVPAAAQLHQHLQAAIRRVLRQETRKTSNTGTGEALEDTWWT
jgi:hypothetical protein